MGKPNLSVKSLIKSLSNSTVLNKNTCNVFYLEIKVRNFPKIQFAKLSNLKKECVTKTTKISASFKMWGCTVVYSVRTQCTTPEIVLKWFIVYTVQRHRRFFPLHFFYDLELLTIVFLCVGLGSYSVFWFPCWYMYCTGACPVLYCTGVCPLLYTGPAGLMPTGTGYSGPVPLLTGYIICCGYI